jgi:hypothetical protein
MLSTVEQEGLCHIVSWLPCGSAFKVHDIERFEECVLPMMGRLSRYKSFIRQLNMYKFRRTAKLGAGGPTKPGAYQHPFFRRDHLNLCRGVIRGDESLVFIRESQEMVTGADRRRAVTDTIITTDIKITTSFQDDKKGRSLRENSKDNPLCSLEAAPLVGANNGRHVVTTTTEHTTTRQHDGPTFKTDLIDLPVVRTSSTSTEDLFDELENDGNVEAGPPRHHIMKVGVPASAHTKTTTSIGSSPSLILSWRENQQHGSSLIEPLEFSSNCSSKNDSTSSGTPTGFRGDCVDITLSMCKGGAWTPFQNDILDEIISTFGGRPSSQEFCG